jgi:hypothetical protein
VKRSITLTVAALAAFALAGCGTGVKSQTAHEVSAVPGYNVTNNEGTVGVRNALLAYPGKDGYKAGSDATVDIRLFNNTGSPVQVVIKSDDATVKDGTITVPSMGLVTPAVKLTGLKKAVNFGDGVNITVEFVGIKEFTVPLNITPPEAS